MAQTFANGDQLSVVRDVLNGNAGDINVLQSQNAKSVSDVAALLADISLTYTVGSNNTVVAGNIVQTRAENFSYQVAASSAVDQNIITAGGVKLYVLTLNVKAFGANGDGVTNDGSAFDDMANEIGYINVPSGTFSLNTRYIDVPIFFEAGGSITIPSGQTVTIRNRISASPKQQIFFGNGQLYLENSNDLGIGEDSKHSYAAWWGIFAIGQLNTIQTALFNKALSAYTSQTREGVFELDCGSYRIDGTVTIPRGVWLKGNSTRRTIIDLVGDGYTALEAGGQAVKITGIQFEQPSASEAYFSGTEISSNFAGTFIQDIVLWNAKIGINLGPNAFLTTVRDVRGIYGREPIGGYPSDSATILVQNNNCFIENIYATNTSFGPRHIVLISSSATSAFNLTVNGVYTTEISIPVKLLSTGSTINCVTISNINFTGSSGLIEGVVSLQTSGTGTIRDVAISNVTSNQFASNLLKIVQSSSGDTDGVSLSSATTGGFAVRAASLTRTNGTLNAVSIGNSVVVKEDADFLFVEKSGTMSRIFVPNHLLPILQIADNGVDFFDPFQVGGILAVKNMGSDGDFPNVNSSGAICFDVGGSDAILKMYGGANLATLAAGTIPTGTSGTDGNLSVSVVNSGRVYFENRTGGTIQVFMALVC